MVELPKLKIWTYEDEDECLISNEERDLTEDQANEIIRRCKAYPDLEAEIDMLNDLVAEKEQEIQEARNA